VNSGERSPGPLVLDQSPQEFFRELVSGALSHRRLKVQALTEFYLVHLLERFLASDELYPGGKGGSAESEPLALLLLRALSDERQRRYEGLRRVGDTSLFLSGFFGDSLARSSVDLAYYVAMGGRAYDALASSRGPAGAPETFGELAQRFEEFVDLFAEIAEMQDLRSNRGLVKLYERFLHTGSERVAEQLRARGVALFSGSGSRVVKH